MAADNSAAVVVGAVRMHTVEKAAVAPAGDTIHTNNHPRGWRRARHGAVGVLPHWGWDDIRRHWGHRHSVGDGTEDSIGPATDKKLGSHP